MTTTERIAFALGLPFDGRFVCGKVSYFERKLTEDAHFHTMACEPADYEHDLNALLEPLGVLRERGWFWGIDTYMDGRFVVTLGRWDGKVKDIERIGAELAPMLALAVAEALEASK